MQERRDGLEASPGRNVLCNRDGTGKSPNVALVSASKKKASEPLPPGRPDDRRDRPAEHRRIARNRTNLSSRIRRPPFLAMRASDWLEVGRGSFS